MIDTGGVVAGIDVATAAVRVSVVTAGGTVVSTGSAPLPDPERPGGGRSEQDASTWWPAARTALREATAALPRRGHEVRAVAVAATSGTIVPVDRAGRPLGPALMYDDRRAAEQNTIAQEAGRDRWARLGLAVSPTAALGRIGWIAKQSYEHPVWRVLHTPDLIGWALTGAPVPADWSHALKSGYDPRVGEWAGEAFDALGVDPDWLPPVAAPTTPVGTVSAEAAAETGLPAGCELRLGMTDGCAGQLACGAVRPGQFVGVLGTTYVLKGVTEELVTDPTGALYSHRHPDGWWLPGGASNTGGEALAGTPADRRAALDDAAAASGPASVVSYPLRRDGERFPFVSAQARGFTVGSPADEVDRHRATLEGVAFLERLALERVRALGIPVEPPMSAAGGGSRSPLWSRIRATALDMPLRVAENADTAFGAALLAAAGSVHRDLAAASPAMVAPGSLVEPDPSERDALERSYHRFVDSLAERGWIAR